MLARPAGRATYHRALGSRELIPQNELRCSEGSGMLIGDPLSEGSNATALPIASSGERRTHFERELNTQEWSPRHKPGPDQLK